MADKAIQSEVTYLKTQNLGYQDIESTTVALRVNTHQAMVCYVSSGPVPAIHLMRHLAGYVQIFFDENRIEDNGKPYAEQKNLGIWFILLDLAVRRLEEAVANSARGDAVGHLSTILSILRGCMGQYGVEQRQGFEIE